VVLLGQMFEGDGKRAAAVLPLPPPTSTEHRAPSTQAAACFRHCAPIHHVPMICICTSIISGDFPHLVPFPPLIHFPPLSSVPSSTLANHRVICARCNACP
jgi:hypothetical protein